MSFIKRDLKNIQNQFISVNELLSLLSDIGNAPLEESAQWLLNHIRILNRTKRLVLENSYTLVEYEYNDNNFYNCPIKTIGLIASGEDDVLCGDCVGFARTRVLADLKNNSVNIDDELIKNSHPYISQSCLEEDDNFYKNQLIDELEKSQSINTQPPQKLSDIHKYAIYLNKGNPLYFQNLELLARIHHELNVMNGYDGRSNKDDRIKDFLRDHGAEYGYSDPKPFHIKMLSSFIHIIKDQKSTSSILSELEKY